MRCKQQTCYVVRCPGLYQKNVMFLHRTLFPELFRTSHGFPSVPASTYLSPGLSLTFWEARRVTTTWAARTTLQPASRCQTRSDNSWRKKKWQDKQKRNWTAPSVWNFKECRGLSLVFWVLNSLDSKEDRGPNVEIMWVCTCFFQRKRRWETTDADRHLKVKWTSGDFIRRQISNYFQIRVPKYQWNVFIQNCLTLSLYHDK